MEQLRRDPRYNVHGMGFPRLAPSINLLSSREVARVFGEQHVSESDINWKEIREKVLGALPETARRHLQKEAAMHIGSISVAGSQPPRTIHRLILYPLVDLKAERQAAQCGIYQYLHDQGYVAEGAGPESLGWFSEEVLGVKLASARDKGLVKAVRDTLHDEHVVPYELCLGPVAVARVI